MAAREKRVVLLVSCDDEDVNERNSPLLHHLIAGTMKSDLGSLRQIRMELLHLHSRARRRAPMEWDRSANISCNEIGYHALAILFS